MSPPFFCAGAAGPLLRANGGGDCGTRGGGTRGGGGSGDSGCGDGGKSGGGSNHGNRNLKGFFSLEMYIPGIRKGSNAKALWSFADTMAVFGCGSRSLMRDE